MSASVFLIHRPVMDYEESLKPYFVCFTRDDAEIALSQMRAFAAKLVARMPEIPSDDDDPDGSKYLAADAKRRAILKRARWPFGVDLSSDFDGFSTQTFNPACVDSMELELASAAQIQKGQL